MAAATLSELLGGLLADRERAQRVARAAHRPAPDPGAGNWVGWACAGAPTIWYDDAQRRYYVSLRQRAPTTDPTPPIRGYAWELYACDRDGERWTPVWHLDTRDVTGRNVTSIEGVALRRYEGRYYYYFSWTWGRVGAWNVEYVTADTPRGVRDRLADPAHWHPVIEGPDRDVGHKDPVVTRLDGEYYMVVGRSLLRAPTPAFADREALTTGLLDSYIEAHGDPVSNPAPVFYDPARETYAYWGNARHGEDIYWFGMTSPDLREWSLDWRRKVFEWGYADNNTARYVDICTAGDELAVCIEWDRDRSLAGDTYVWRYDPEFPLPELDY